MERMIPYEKLSKKKRREIDRRRRGDWGGINPVTRRPPNPKAYVRKSRHWKDDTSDAGIDFCNFLVKRAGSIRVEMRVA